MGQYLDKEGLKAYHKIVEDLNRKNLKSIVLTDTKLDISSDDQIFSIGFDATSPLSVSKDDNTIIYSLDQTKVDAATVNGHTVGADVPTDAKFTDTIYDDTTIQSQLAHNEIITLTLFQYPSGTLTLPTDYTANQVADKIEAGKAVLHLTQGQYNIYFTYDAKDPDGKYWFTAPLGQTISNSIVSELSLGRALIIKSGDTYLARIYNISLPTSQEVEDAAEKMVSITWSDLKDKRDAGTLIAGQQYRITDYTCTTTWPNTQSAGHQFDIIVTADSTSKLNEQARAILHEGDTYFANSKLEAWKLWYSLDNSMNIGWSDSENGKGVIYRMIDEWNNDVPYDFKNIQFLRYKITNAKQQELVGKYLGIQDINELGIIVDTSDSIWEYTFSELDENNVVSDASIKFNTCYNNVIKTYIDHGMSYLANNVLILDNYYSISETSFDSECYDNSIVNGSYNKFYNSCYENIVYGGNNIFNARCHYNILSVNCTNNIFGEACEYNSLGSNCSFNTLGESCEYNEFGSYCSDNTLGSSCSHITFGTTSLSYGTITKGLFRYNTVEGGSNNIAFTGTNESTFEKQAQYYHIKAGVSSENSDYPYTIVPELGRNYETIIACNSSGQIIEYCEADLIMVPLTGVDIEGESALTAVGSYTYKISPIPTNATDIKSVVWSSDANATYGSIDADTGVATVKQLPPQNASITITATVTTNSGQTFTATKRVSISKAS